MSELSDTIRAFNEFFFVPESPPDTSGVLLGQLKQIADISPDAAARVEALATLGYIIGLFPKDAAPRVH